MAQFSDTIAAIASPPGEGGIGIIRVSGLDAFALASRVFAPLSGALADAAGYTAKFGRIVVDGERVDDAIALVFRAPKSYTAEDVVELQMHGGPVVLNMALDALLKNGAKEAGPGEFTRRAFLNGRISLTQAEAVQDLIGAAGRAGQFAAAAQSDGALFKKTQQLKDELLAAQSHIAASIDFPEEDVEEIDAAELTHKLDNVTAELDALLASYETGEAVLRGVPTVIAGSPNVGKSTIMNLLSGFERAIVSPRAGTTRDVVEHRLRLGGTTLILADTAGYRAGADDEIEVIGISRALERIDRALLVLAVFDASRELDADDRALIEKLDPAHTIAVVNKTDLARKLETAEIEARFPKTVYISAQDPEAIKTLDDAVKQIVGAESLNPDGALLANARQRRCAADARDRVFEVAEALRNGVTLDVVFAILDEALGALLELSGERVSDAVIDEVFERFCVGK